jgi:hypothetical protein
MFLSHASGGGKKKGGLATSGGHDIMAAGYEPATGYRTFVACPRTKTRAVSPLDTHPFIVLRTHHGWMFVFEKNTTEIFLLILILGRNVLKISNT